MPTPNPRINIVTNAELYQSLVILAESEDKSLSAVAKDLILEALDKREDRYLSNIANARDKGDSKTMSHKEIWNL